MAQISPKRSVGPGSLCRLEVGSREICRAAGTNDLEAAQRALVKAKELGY